MITFSAIPLDSRVPGTYVEFDGSKAIGGLPALPAKILLIGQRLPTAIVPALLPTRIATASGATAALGVGSRGAVAAAALVANAGRAETWVIGVDDPAGAAAATATITITGAATANGVVALMIDGVLVPVATLIGATAAATATAIVAAINERALPVTAAAAAGVVTLTARSKGDSGNAIDVRLNYFANDVVPAGLGVAIEPFAGGAGDIDLLPVFAALGDSQFTTIVLPGASPAMLAQAEAELTARGGPMKMIEGMAYAGLRGSYATLTAAGAARNSLYSVLIGAKGSPSHPTSWAAAMAGQVAASAAIDPARPMQTLPLNGVLPPHPADRFIPAERDVLLRNGISTWTADPAGSVALERVITTYRTNAGGLPDIAWLDVTTPLTLFYIRAAVRQRIQSRFPRHKLAGDDARFGPGQAIVTPKIIRGELLALFRDLEEAGLVEGFDQFKGDLVVERSATDPGRIDALIPPNIVNQFRTLAARIEFRL